MSSENKEGILEQYLYLAISDFNHVCKEDMTYSGTSFVDVLSGECIDILSLGVAYYWLSSKALNSELLRNKLSTKDASFYSPANILKEVSALRNTVRDEYARKICEYSYHHGDIENLGG